MRIDDIITIITIIAPSTSRPLIGGMTTMPREKSNALPESESRESEQESRVPVGAAPNRQPSPTDNDTAGNWLPPGWQQQKPADPKWQGKRFVSPDGTASFSAYITPVAQEPIAQHMKNVAFAMGSKSRICVVK